MVEQRENFNGSLAEQEELTRRVLAGLAATAPRAGDLPVRQAVGQVTARYRRRRKTKRLVVLAAAAAVTGLIVVSIFQLTSHLGKPTGGDGPAPDAILVAGAILLDGVRVESGASITAGSTVSTEAPPARVEIGGRLKLGLDRQTRATVDELSALRLALSLERGRVALDVPTGRHWRVSVATDRGLVEVKGTVFAVEQKGEQLRVEVLRGTVAVTAPGSPTVMIGAGERVELPASTRSRLDDESANRIRELLADRPPEQSTPAPAEPDPAVSTEPEIPHQGSGKTSEPRTKKKEPPPARPSPGELIRQARACRKSGDWQCAAERYRRVRTDYPGRPEAATALVALAGIELDQLGRPAAALEHYRQYLGRGGKGALAVEARYGVCRALKALGRKDEERQALRDFVAKHPSGVYASAASKRLAELGP